jgi:hypothetical protein
MKNTASTLLILAAALLLPACQNFRPAAETPPVAATSKKWPASSTHPITIVTGKYSGVFRLNGKPQQVVGQQDFDLKPGVHTFDVGVVARSSFSFEVLQDGNIGTITNPKAAYPDGRRLVLRTTPVTIDPGDLGKGGNACKLMAYPSSRIDERKTFDLIPALTYQLDSGGAGGNAKTMIFEVREDGTVWGNSRAANGSGKTLHLHVGWLDVVTKSTAPYKVGISGDYYGNKRVPVIFGLETNISVGRTPSKPYTPDYGQAFPKTLRVGSETFTVSVPWDQ